MSTSSIISNLQQSLNCAGKCDCCSSLQQQINEINSKIANLKPVDENAIVNRAIEGSKLLMPGIAGTVVALKIAPVLTEVNAVSRIASDALKLGGDALKTGTQALGKATGALSQLAALAASIAAALGVLATLKFLGERIDAVERYVDGVSDDVTRLYTLVNSTRNIAKNADAKASQALVELVNTNIKIQQINQEISATNIKVFEARNLALKANDKAQSAQQSADKANTEIARITPIAVDAKAKADALEINLNIAKSQINQLNQQVEAANNNIKVAFNLASDANANAVRAINDAKQAQTIAEQSKSIANNAITEANKSKSIANDAIAEANKSKSIANDAIAKANKAIQEAEQARNDLAQAQQKIKQLEAELQEAKTQAEAALQLGGTAINTASNVAQGLGTLQNQVGVVGGAANTANNRASDALGQISTIKNGVVTNPAIQNAIAIPIGGIKSTQQKQAEQIKQIEQKIANPGGINTQEVTRQEFEQIKQKLGEAEKVNTDGNRKLDEILNKLPVIPLATATAVLARSPSIPQIKQAVGEATCESARSGCIAGALGNQSNGLKQDFGQKLRDLEQGLNAGANAAQLALLNTINTKLGAEVVGGVTGLMTRIANSALLERALSVLTFAATVHNAAMLSNDIAQTLLGAINNVLSLVLPKDHEGQAIDVGQIINSTVENAIKGAIGATNYATLTESWAKANRIYQATTNILNNFQGLTSTVLNGVELVAGQTGKIANALKASGEVLDSAYQWMNPQPKINRVTNFLQNLQNGASTIQQVTQAPIDTINAITSLQEANTEFFKAIKEDDKPENQATAVEQPQKLAEDKALARIASQGLELLDADLEADD